MRISVLLCIGILLLSAIGCSGQPSTDSTPTDAVAEVSVEAESAPGAQPMRGLFTYMADAALFEDCVNGRRYPVAMEADYISVERAYLEARSEPGAPVLVLIRASVERRPPMEGDGEIEAIVVEEFEAAFPGEGCDGNEADPASPR